MRFLLRLSSSQITISYPKAIIFLHMAITLWIHDTYHPTSHPIPALIHFAGSLGTSEAEKCPRKRRRLGSHRLPASWPKSFWNWWEIDGAYLGFERIPSEFRGSNGVLRDSTGFDGDIIGIKKMHWRYDGIFMRSYLETMTTKSDIFMDYVCWKVRCTEKSNSSCWGATEQYIIEWLGVFAKCIYWIYLIH